MLTVIVGLVGSGKSRTRRPLPSRYSVMPSTEVTLTGAARDAVFAGAAALGFAAFCAAAGFAVGFWAEAVCAARVPASPRTRIEARVALKDTFMDEPPRVAGRRSGVGKAGT